jgi:hypothetical protein
MPPVPDMELLRFTQASRVKSPGSENAEEDGIDR